MRQCLARGQQPLKALDSVGRLILTLTLTLALTLTVTLTLTLALSPSTRRLSCVASTARTWVAGRSWAAPSRPRPGTRVGRPCAWTWPSAVDTAVRHSRTSDRH